MFVSHHIMLMKILPDEYLHMTVINRNRHLGNSNITIYFLLNVFHAFLLHFLIDRVKVINGTQPPLTSENNTNNNINNDSGEIENARLLNILNWSPLENLVINTTTQVATSPPPQIANDENEPKSKNSYNAVQISIELQKKMLK